MNLRMNIPILFLVVFFLTNSGGVVYGHAFNTAKELRFGKPFVFLLGYCKHEEEWACTIL